MESKIQLRHRFSARRAAAAPLKKSTCSLNCREQPSVLRSSATRRLTTQYQFFKMSSERDRESPSEEEPVFSIDFEAQNSSITNGVLSSFGFDAKPKQIEAIYSLVVERKDTILIAQTGFGKSLVFQVIPLLYPVPRVALLIMPLLALQDEQARKMSSIRGCRPFVLNGDNNNTSNLERLRNGSFTHSIVYTVNMLV